MNMIKAWIELYQLKYAHIKTKDLYSYFDKLKLCNDAFEAFNKYIEQREMCDLMCGEVENDG